MNGLTIYLGIAVFVYIFFKTRCRVEFTVNGQEINPLIIEIAILIISFSWIISIPLMMIYGKIGHE